MTMREKGPRAFATMQGLIFSDHQKAPEMVTSNLVVKIRIKCSWYHMKVQDTTSGIISDILKIPYYM
jgi:hypothetical protein